MTCSVRELRGVIVYFLHGNSSELWVEWKSRTIEASVSNHAGLCSNGYSQPCISNRSIKAEHSREGGDCVKVRLTEHDENWVRMFEEEVRLLREIFGDQIIKYEHFGSTSVPGLKAKPVIDMMCIINDIKKIDGFNEQMRLLGYDVAGESGIPGRRLFRMGGENRTHHIHVYQSDNPEIERHLVFRDYLRAHPEEVARYGKLKEELTRVCDDASFYSNAKKPFVLEMEQRALQWFRETQG